MSQVVFWGNVRGQLGCTSNVMAASTMIGIDYALRVLVGQAHKTRFTLENAYARRPALIDPSMKFTNMGFEALERLARSNRLKPGMISDYTIPILHNRLDLLTGTMEPLMSAGGTVHEAANEIYSCASRQYHLTMLDAPSGIKNLAVTSLLEASDLIVVNLTQNLHVLERFFSQEEWPDALHNKPFLLVLGQYDLHSKYTAANIARKFHYPHPIYTVPYCTDYKDAYNDQWILEFFLRNRNVSKRHENYFFVQEVRRLNRAILEKIGIHSEPVSLERRVS